MTTNTEYTTPPPPPLTPRPPLRRSQSDKVIAGVAGGFARWLGIDPVIVRVILVVLAVFGGSGLLLYVIGWLFIPAEGTSTSSADEFFRQSRQPGSTARTVLIVVGVVVAVIVFLNLIGAVFGGWGGGGSVLLLLAVGALVLYLMNRQPAAPVAAVPPVAPVPPAGTPPMTDEATPGATAAVTQDPSVAPPVASGVTAHEPAATAPPAAYAYGGAGQYPGYVAPTPAYEPPAPRPQSYLGLATLSLAVIVTGLLASLQVTGVTDLPLVVIPAVALAILGVGILVGSVAGRARWLLWFAVPTLLVTIMVSFIPANLGENLASGLRTGVGERSWTPVTVVEATQDYELGIGSATLDLTGLTIPAGVTTVPVDASVGIGELIVTVPDDVRVIVDASVGTGDLTIEGVERQTGPSPSIDTELPDGPATGPVIELTVRTNLGSLEVSRA
jgi:phage shock protein PspC (stress-responsive transcriptional regulator)